MNHQEGLVNEEDQHRQDRIEESIKIKAQGNEFYKAGNYSKAIEAYQNAISKSESRNENIL